MGQLASYFLVIAAGIAQAFQGPINNQLRDAVKNVWIAGAIVVAIELALFTLVFFFWHRPLPSSQDILDAPWYLGLGGVLGTLIVFTMLTLPKQLGAGVFNGLLITAMIITSLALDHFGVLGLEKIELGWQRIVGGFLMIAGVLAIAKGSS